MRGKSTIYTRRVVWVSEGRDKAALDEFFKIIGPKASKNIRVVAMDQHEPYYASVQENAPQATVVWDQFHIMQNFEKAVNEQRKTIHEKAYKGTELKRLTRGRYRYLFLKKASRRTLEEKHHIDDVLKTNDQLAKLEIIKERMLTFFHQKNLSDAKKVFLDVGDWAMQAQLWDIVKWHDNLELGWNTLKNYYKYRVTTAVSEGFNNVIKTLKKMAYGYRNMPYFKLKIMQKCGYLNSRFISLDNSITCTNSR